MIRSLFKNQANYQITPLGSNQQNWDHETFNWTKYLALVIDKCQQGRERTETIDVLGHSIEQKRLLTSYNVWNVFEHWLQRILEKIYEAFGEMWTLYINILSIIIVF